MEAVEDGCCAQYAAGLLTSHCSLSALSLLVVLVELWPNDERWKQVFTINISAKVQVRNISSCWRLKVEGCATWLLESVFPDVILAVRIAARPEFSSCLSLMGSCAAEAAANVRDFKSIIQIIVILA